MAASSAPSSAREIARYERALAAAGLNRRPVAVLDLASFDSNARALEQRAGATPIRVATKSLRVPFLIERAASTFEGGLLAFSLAEALDLVEQGFEDVLVAYPTADREALAQLVTNERALRAVTLMVDSRAHADMIVEAHRSHSISGLPVRVCIELDCSYVPLRGIHLGALRSPLFTPGQVEELARALMRTQGIALVGLMGYESQIAGTPNRGRSPMRLLTRGMQALSAREVAARRGEAVERVREVCDLEFVNGGGTGSIESTCADPSVTEVAAGSGLIGPASFDHFVGFRPEPALFVGFPVVRRPAPGVATILGGGWIASGPPGKDRLPSVVYPNPLGYVGLEGAGEVQTPLRGRAAEKMRVGDTVWMRHAKAGEVAEHVDTYAIVQGDQVVDVVPTYRGLGRAYI
ncbi:hypothetical protein HMPREF1484_01438 [Dermabacter sp. HFH0086]|uniref:alanine racemase n=1 Tax=Dermabacter TaxID=36739 RepID=UPI0003547C81|nr:MULTISPECIES: alanine racemase [Dermabacter]EPH15801.1 hypothetical protein HMPREF1484_01438 [Dermabacter sp. HFH0086]